MISDRLVFTTSGTTGVPRAWARTREQANREVEVLVELLGRPDHVVSFAPPAHLFGWLFSAAIPAQVDCTVEVVLDHLSGFRAPACDRLLIATVPSAWNALRRHTDALAGCGKVTLVHGTGPLPDAVEYSPVLEAEHVRGVELFGSTETGGVAWRALGSEQPWQLLHDVDIATPDPKNPRMRVSSPRLASEHSGPMSEFTTEDLIAMRSPRTFEFLGRSDRVVKVNGRRCDLDTVERKLQGIGIEASCKPRQTPISGTAYDLVVHRGPSTQEIWRALPAALGGQPLPNMIRASDEDHE